ncbi:type iii desmin [Lasius niger]|uniref:Type iii desmin n=1 Tax=Lasius niger TaxID=67767 RepID=A0A0J7KCG8_LASNI|nr:type iii desmin [Lasius niger]KMQ88068.1 type iii desmin [Lasius niger]
MSTDSENSTGKNRENVMEQPTPISDVDLDVEITGIQRESSVQTRSLRSGKKSPQIPRAESSGRSGGSSSVRKEPTDSGKSTRTKKNKNKKIPKMPSSSSEKEDESEVFAPAEFRVMSATNVGALGLEYLRKVKNLRCTSKGLNGEVSGEIKRKLARAIDIVNTLIFKAEDTGNPDSMKLKNKSHIVKLKKYKIEDIRRKKELDDMKAAAEALEKDVLDLRDRLDEVEVERVKDKAYWRLERHKLRKQITSEIKKESGMATLMQMRICLEYLKLR